MPIVPRPHGIRPQPSRIRALPVSARLLALVIVIVPVLAGCSEPAARVTATASASSSPTPTRQVTVAVPNVVGMKGDAAADTLKEAGFTEKPTYADVDGEETVQEESDGTVTAQGPQADTQAPVDQPITLMVRHDRADASASASAVATEPESAPEPAQAQEPEPAPEPAQPQEHLSSINPNNWLPLLAFRRRLIAGEVVPESSTASVAPTAEASETAMVGSIRNAACRPISAAKKQQILSLEPTGMSAREIAAQVGVTESTVRATCRQAKQPPRRKRRFTADDLQRAQQLHAQGRTYIEIGLELGFGRDTVSKHLVAAQA